MPRSNKRFRHEFAYHICKIAHHCNDGSGQTAGKVPDAISRGSAALAITGVLDVELCVRSAGAKRYQFDVLRS